MDAKDGSLTRTARPYAKEEISHAGNDAELHELVHVSGNARNGAGCSAAAN